ncbi:hypothetical protein [Bradyrhizobium sp. STM 3809]|uniref:hypothetical protein n=1 Tax=Bradyrhizobium sp. STM 3809 TaxID=551936 RepID=UPI0011121734|nr:hypothetical protein [Bradyrhizobium sp. STM 3809]
MGVSTNAERAGSRAEDLQQFPPRSIAAAAWVCMTSRRRPMISMVKSRDLELCSRWPVLSSNEEHDMPRDTAEPHDDRRPPTPIRGGKTPPPDQLVPPLIVDGPEAVRDPYC